ncbi:MAG: hypothetical protein EB078_02945 [Proteobacteria bacterium]|nr:hypothetical protein [Pseudomonadota bacterium]NDC23729.1 hypothetical protein [Pseudomonadota bacterium]NDD03840.1 hypothetical protein [Pseudomonadota bacterium]
MRILYLGSLSPNACSSFYANAAEALGHEVFRWDPGMFASEHVWESFLIRWNHHPLKKKIDACSEFVLRKCQELNIELVLNLAENFLSSDLLQELRSLPCPPKLIYHSHDNNFSDGILKPSDFFDTLSLYDCVFTTKSQNLQRYKMLGQPLSFYIPSAFEPQVHRPLSANESKLGGKSFQVTFVGTYDRSRDKFLNAVGWEQLYVWGDRWTKYRNYRKYRDHIVPHAIYHPDFADVISHSEIALGLLREEAEDRHTQRTFEIPACGTLQIAPRNEEILSYFDEDKEIVCFDSLDELKDKVTYYKAHLGERKKIAAKGFDRVQRGNHTYQDRIKMMLSKIHLAD